MTQAPPPVARALHGTQRIAAMPRLRRARAAFALAAACAAHAAYGGSVTGTASYRERMTLPSGATFEAVLEDVSRAGAPATVLGRFGPEPAAGPPFAFAIAYDDASVVPGHRYNVRAVVRHEGRLLFTTDRSVPPFTSDRPLELRMVRVASSPPADAPKSAATLRNTYWKLVALNGIPATVPAGGREVHLVLAAAEPRVTGSGGCNRVAGTFELDGTQLRFVGMAGTRMACPDGMEQEAAFLRMLATVARFRLAGDALTLADDKGKAVAKFRAVALR